MTVTRRRWASSSAAACVAALLASGCTGAGRTDGAPRLYPSELVADVRALQDSDTGLIRRTTSDAATEGGAGDLYATAHTHEIARLSGANPSPLSSRDVAQLCDASPVDPLMKAGLASWVTTSPLPAQCQASEADTTPPPLSATSATERWLAGMQVLTTSDIEARETLEVDPILRHLEEVSSRATLAPYQRWQVSQIVTSLGGEADEDLSRAEERPNLPISHPRHLLDWRGYIALSPDCDCDQAVEEAISILEQSPDLFLAHEALDLLDTAGVAQSTVQEYATEVLDDADVDWASGGAVPLPTAQVGSIDVTYAAARLLTAEDFSSLVDESMLSTLDMALNESASPDLYTRLVVDAIRTAGGEVPLVSNPGEKITAWFDESHCETQLRACLSMVDVANALGRGQAAHFTLTTDALPSSTDEATVAVLEAYAVPENVDGVAEVDSAGPRVRDRLVQMAGDPSEPLNIQAAAAVAGAGLDPSPEEFSRIEEAVLSRLGCPASPSLMSAPDGTCSWEASIDALRAGVPLGE